MIKLVVGCTTIEELANIMSLGERLDGYPIIRTRMMPKKADQIEDQGSLYRVINGFLLCRQPIVAFRSYLRDDGNKGTYILVREEIIPVVPRPMRPFQGWRYLTPEDAPHDLDDDRSVSDRETLPRSLRHSLAELCLI